MPADKRSRSRTARSDEPAIAESIDALRRIMRALRLAERRAQSEVGLSAAQLFVLRALEDGSEASLSELARRTMTDRSSVAAVVDRLLDAALVVRGTARADRRRAAIVVTAAGRVVLDRSPESPTNLLVTALCSLPDRQRKSVAAGLAALSEGMGLGDDPTGMLFEDDRATRPTTQRRVRT
ncbi:hypothetical protein BH11GEM1_BH11GEM1_08360 [soil metagenome]